MKIPFYLAVVGAAAFFLTGCAGPEQKLGRGMSNMFEPVRGGEFRRSMEQGAVFGGPDMAFTTGVIHGVNRTVGRTALGVFEVVTFPIPPYHPIATKHFSAAPAYPDNYSPGKPEDAMFETDNNLDFSGGDVAPWFPGSKFRVFDN
jgi:putative exosortase-associated protein (TIGR04073 family)